MNIDIGQKRYMMRILKLTATSNIVTENQIYWNWPAALRMSVTRIWSDWCDVHNKSFQLQPVDIKTQMDWLHLKLHKIYLTQRINVPGIFAIWIWLKFDASTLISYWGKRLESKCRILIKRVYMY